MGGDDGETSGDIVEEGLGDVKAIAGYCYVEGGGVVDVDAAGGEGGPFPGGGGGERCVLWGWREEGCRESSTCG